MYKHTKNGWELHSHTGRLLGTFGSFSALQKRETEINYFKHRETKDK